MSAIFKKELRGYFLSASGYIFMGIFLLLTGIFFSISNLSSASSNYLGIISQMSVLFLFIVPIITMKTISDETKSKTDQLLLTSPLSIRDIVIGKFLAANALFLITLAITFIYPLILSLFGTVSYPEIITGYIGIFLLGSAFIAIGIFISSLTENIIISAVLTFAAVLWIMLMDTITTMLPKDYVSGIVFALILTALFSGLIYYTIRNLFISFAVAIIGILITIIISIINHIKFEGFIVNLFGWLSIMKKNQNFSMGILNLTSIVFFISFIFVFLFLTIRVIEKKRWS